MRISKTSILNTSLAGSILLSISSPAIVLGGNVQVKPSQHTSNHQPSLTQKARKSVSNGVTYAKDLASDVKTAIEVHNLPAKDAEKRVNEHIENMGKKIKVAPAPH